MKYVSVSRAAELLGVCTKTLHRWESLGNAIPMTERSEGVVWLVPDLRTEGGHRRYCVDSLRPKTLQEPESKCVMAYARVSSSGQRADLVRQTDVLKCHLTDRKEAIDVEVVTDVGSGMNFQKKGLKRVLHAIVSRKVSEVVVVHPDRLMRFGFGLMEQLCELHQVKLTVLARPAEDFTAQLSRDLIEIITVFSAKLYGKRSADNRATRSPPLPSEGD